MSSPQEVFYRACEKVFDCWTALTLAVENNWGGDDSATKKDRLLREVVEFCLNAKELHSDEIEDLLADKLDEYFNVTLEDGSETEIASILVKLHSTCSAADFSFANELMSGLQKCTAECVAQESSSEAESDTPKRSSRGPKTATDEDGWTTVL